MAWIKPSKKDMAVTFSYFSRNGFDDMIGARSEELAKEAFSRMDVHLDLNMTMSRPLDGLQQVQYLKEFGEIHTRLDKRLEPALVNGEQWTRDKTYLWHEERIVVNSDGIWALLKWTHESSGHEAFSWTPCKALQFLQESNIS